MKIRLRTIQGNVLFGTVVTTGIICLYLGSYLTLVRNENLLTLRSQTWNTAVPVAEAGIEEALTRLRWNTNIVATDKGWALTNGYYMKSNSLSADEYYIVGIYPIIGSNGPTIVSEGFARPPFQTTFISRTIQVNTTPRPIFSGGMEVDQSVDLMGKSLLIDSFDSTDPLYSTGGLYDKTKRKDNGSLNTNSGITNAMDTGNAQIYGKLGVGAGGTPGIGATGRVGDKAFVDDSSIANNGKIQTDHWTDDVNVEMEPVEAPFSSALTPPKNVTVLGTKYDYVLTAGGTTAPTDYEIANPDDFSGKVLIQGTGKIRLYVKSTTFSFIGSDFIKIEPGATLEIYAKTPHVVIAGGGIQNPGGTAGQFTYYGLPSNSRLEFKGNGSFIGAIHAPNADFILNGSGSFAGASVTKTVKMKGNYEFHFDESLAKMRFNGYVATSWDERQVTWKTILASGLTKDELY